MTVNDELDDEIVEKRENNEKLDGDEQLTEQPSSNADQAVDAVAPAVTKKRNKAEIVINIALWVAIAVLVVAVFLRLFVYSTVEVDGASMKPTYNSNDKNETVLVNKMATPERGDVVVFYINEVENKFMAQFAGRDECGKGQPYEKYIKRVVATEGDKIWVRWLSGNDQDMVYQVVVDTADGNRITEDYYVKKGQKLDEETFYLHTNTLSKLGNLAECTEDNPFVVSKGCFFAMGDNRADSSDSRAHGEFKVSQLFGVVLDK